MTTVYFVGSRKDISLCYAAATLKEKCKLQKKDAKVRLVLVEPASDLCRKNFQITTSLPYAGRIYMAGMALLGFDKYNPFHEEDCFIPRQFVAQKSIPLLKPINFDCVMVANTTLEFKLVDNRCLHIIIDGQAFPPDFIILGEQIFSFPILSLNEALQATELGNANYNAIPFAPSKKSKTSVIGENIYFCGKAAGFETYDASALSGIYVAQYIKTFGLKVMADYFTLVTTNDAKKQEYVAVCGPMHTKNPTSVLFAVHFEQNEREEVYTKESIAKLEIQQRGSGEVVDEESDYFFVDASSLAVYAKNDPAWQGLMQQHHQYLQCQLENGASPTAKHVEKLYDSEETVRLCPGVNVQTWIEFLDRFPHQDQLQDGHGALWRCTVCLVGKTPKQSQTDSKINDLNVFPGYGGNGTSRGKIVCPGRGQNGFGFDSRFNPFAKDDDMNGVRKYCAETFGEMSMSEKLRYSARFEAIIGCLYSLLMRDF